MITKNPLIITRRNFSIAALSVGLTASLKVSVFAGEPIKEQADALMQLMPDGMVVVYSGGGQLGPYGDPQMQHAISSELGIDPKQVVFDYSGNPVHLPGMLGQCCNHMSFTNRATNLRAAAILRKFNTADKTAKVKYHIDDRVSLRTRKMAYGLAPVGVIVAVRQLS